MSIKNRSKIIQKILVLDLFIHTSPKSIDLMQNTSPIVNNPLLTLQLSYRE